MWPFKKEVLFADFSSYRWQELADYNSRVAKGIVHTEEFKARMARDQSLFDDDQTRKAEEKGWIIMGGH